jgi:hypothetical protein
MSWIRMANSLRGTGGISLTGGQAFARMVSSVPQILGGELRVVNRARCCRIRSRRTATILTLKAMGSNESAGLGWSHNTFVSREACTPPFYPLPSGRPTFATNTATEACLRRAGNGRMLGPHPPLRQNGYARHGDVMSGF